MKALLFLNLDDVFDTAISFLFQVGTLISMFYVSKVIDSFAINSGMPLNLP